MCKFLIVLHRKTAAGGICRPCLPRASLFLFLLAVLAGRAFADNAPSEGVEAYLRLTVTSPLPFPNVPMDPMIDFPAFISYTNRR
jgi:hypothetical protein